MKMTREEAIDYLRSYAHWTFAKDEDPCDEFYIKGSIYGIDIVDLDRWA